MKFHSKWQRSMWHHEWLTCLIKWVTDTIHFHSDGISKVSLINDIPKKILHSQKNKEEIDTGNTKEYDFT